MTATDVDPAGILGRDRRHEALSEYEAHEAYADQDDIRVVKDLMFTYHVVAPSPMIVGQEIVQERIAKVGEIVYTDELGAQGLEKGERLHSFFTTEELETMSQAQARLVWRHGVVPEALSDFVGVKRVTGDDATPAGGVALSEMGTHEIAEYIKSEGPTVNQLLEEVGDDPDTAKRVLEAENIATDNDPRTSLEAGLSRIIGEKQR